MSKIAVATKRFSGFMKRNAMYLLILLCIASVATVIALAVTGNFGDQNVNLTPDDIVDTPIDTPTNKPSDTLVDKPSSNDTPIVNKPVETLTFGAPCLGSVVVEHSNTVLVWNSTLSQYSTHTGVDFSVSDDKVMAVANGTVSSVGYDTLKGHYIVINHADNYQSRYYSLAEGITLKEGDKVTKGQVIATVSDTMATEAHQGKHLHFEMSKDGENIDPLTVIVLAEK
jgi:murein DD-endopeptidase MepM/ murein hydrolase activator NlpD